MLQKKQLLQQRKCIILLLYIVKYDDGLQKNAPVKVANTENLYVREAHLLHDGII